MERIAPVILNPCKLIQWILCWLLTRSIVKDLVNEKEIEKFGEWVENEFAKLSTHQRRHAGEQVLHDFRRVGVVRWNQMKPELAVVQKQLRTRRNPPRTEWQTSSASRKSWYCAQTSRSTQPSTLCGMVKWVWAFGLSNNKWRWWMWKLYSVYTNQC